MAIRNAAIWPTIDDEEIQAVYLRAQEMGRYVGDGVLDAGITGFDWIKENGCDVQEVCELPYSKETSNPTQWVLAVPNESPVTRPEDLEGGIVATELVGVTKRYFQDKNIHVKVEFSWGATEVKARLVNAIVELTETGTSLRANNLRIIDTVIVSTTRLIANKAAWRDPFKREKIENISILLQAAIAARGKVGLKMNVRRADLDCHPASPAGGEEPDDLGPGGLRVRRHRGDRRRPRGTVPGPRTQAGGGVGDHHVSAEQSDSLMSWGRGEVQESQDA